MKGLAKKNNKTRGKRPRRKNNKKTTRKGKIRGGRSHPPTPNPSNGNEFIDNDNEFIDNDNWVNELVCPYDYPEIHPDEIWNRINVPPHLRDNKEMWLDICQNREREERIERRQRTPRNGGKKRKTYKKQK